MPTSLWKSFEGLLPSDPLLIVRVTAHNADGTSTVQFPNGTTMRARGQVVAVGDPAFLRGGEVRGPAPDITPVELEV